VTAPRFVSLSVDASGQRLDQFLVEQIAGLSRGHAQRLIEAGHVQVHPASGVAPPGRGLRPSSRLQPGDRVLAEVPAPSPLSLEPEEISLQVVYEDDEMLVLDKPAGMVVHPAPGHERGTLVHALLARYPDLPGINGVQRPGIVHRLDLNTSGLLMVAKSERAQRSLAAQLAEHRVTKGYLALVAGRPEPASGVIEAPIGRDPAQRQRMAVVAHGRPARTRYVVLGSFGGHSLVLALPESGRMHQIRVHLAAIGHPVAGDRLYGGDTTVLRRQFLHAFRLRFARPRDGATVECGAPLPPDLMRPLAGLLGADQKSEPPEAAIAAMLELGRQRFHVTTPPAPG
jgi:23S rRNA pseudouridine1911/1915/1917 synthase